jgi:lipopolysaccharide export LptBFGC system permease protein LptF
VENVKVDIFFVKTDNIPNLYAYEIELAPMSEEKKREEMNKILNALPYYLRRRGRHWARDGNFIISDVEVNDEEFKNILQELKGNEKFQLEKNLGAKFYLVEVIKSGAPRIYSEKKGTWVKINENEAYLLTTSQTQGTPVPIIVRLPETYEDFRIEDAIISITSMTLLHWGSIKPPRLPVTTHYADKIGQFLLEGIISDLEGNIPFWL